MVKMDIICDDVFYDDVNYKGESGTLTVNDKTFHYQAHASKTDVKCSWARVEKRQLSPETASTHTIKLLLISGKQAVFTVKDRATLEEMRDDVQKRMEAAKACTNKNDFSKSQCSNKTSNKTDYQSSRHTPSQQTVTISTMSEKEVQGTKNGVIHVIPTGKWRDGLCNCCAFGCCHPMCCLGFWCEHVLAGQVMTRMSRDWLGGPGPRPSASDTCRIATIIYFAFIVACLIDILVAIVETVAASTQCTGGREAYDFDTGTVRIRCPDGSFEDQSQTSLITGSIGSSVAVILYAFWLYFFISVCRSRQAVRKKFQIPPGECGSMEDCCCSYWFPCCVVQQMARHTNDYNQYDVAWCSGDCFNRRGQQTIVPEIV